MDREDARKVIKNLSEKPFICADDFIVVAGGYLVTTKAHFDNLKNGAAKGKRTNQRTELQRRKEERSGKE